jgi:hypothetical protein
MAAFPFISATEATHTIYTRNTRNDQFHEPQHLDYKIQEFRQHFAREKSVSYNPENRANPEPKTEVDVTGFHCIPCRHHHIKL